MMANIMTNHIAETAIARGIRTVGIGKKGSKPLSPELAQEIAAQLQTDGAPAVVQGAFFGALFIKGIINGERVLEKVFAPETLADPLRLTEAICPEAPSLIKDICVRLLRREVLDRSTAEELGRFLFSNEPGDGARGLVASILRVRYETREEYAGLLSSLQETIEPPFRERIPPGQPIIQIAEPFDGVDQSHMITPLLAGYLQGQGYRVVTLVGQNSGPKAGYNLFDLVKALKATMLKRNQELQDKKPPFGWYLHQADMSKPMDRWVELRRQIIKRPFLAALERVVNPVSAQTIIASVFHPPYSEKMAFACQDAGFPGIIVIRNGMEGTLAFPLMREVNILCCVQQKDGTYASENLKFDPQKYLDTHVAVEEKLQSPSLGKNAELISAYAQSGRTGDNLFDLRVKATCAGIRDAIAWIERNREE